MNDFVYAIPVTLYVYGESEEQAMERAKMFLGSVGSESMAELAETWGVDDWDVEV